MGIIKPIQTVEDLPPHSVLKRGVGYPRGKSPVRLAGGIVCLSFSKKGGLTKELILPKKNILGKDVPISKVVL